MKKSDSPVFFLLIAFIFVLTSLPILTFGQSILTGKIITKVDNAPLIGASVLVKGTYEGCYTNNDGTFNLESTSELPLYLEVSYLGFKKQEVLVTAYGQSIVLELEEQIFQSNEVVVKAQLRDQVLQDVPVSVAVIDKNFIDHSAEIDDPGDLVPYVPGFSGMNYSSAGSTYTIRGINTNALGLGAESKVAIFHDGAYNGRVQSAARGFFDVQRVEISKGPQSSLFGRNATAGAINIYSNAPKFQNDASIGLKTGNWGQMGLDWMINTPISDNFAFRFAGKLEKRDGSLKVSNQDNRELGIKDIIANRVSLLWRPSNTFNVNLKLEHQKTEGGGIPIKSTNTMFGATAEKFDREITLDGMPFDNNEFKSGNLQLNWVVNKTMALKSISSINKNDQEFLGDFDGLPTNILKINNPNNFTNFMQELRLEGKGKNLDWMIAGSYFSEDAAFDVNFISEDAFMIPIFFGFTDPTYFTFCNNNPACGEFTELAQQDIKSNSVAVYGNLEYAINEKLKTSFGLRYTKDNKDFTSMMELGNGAFHSIGFFNIQGPTGVATSKDSWSGLQPRFTLDYKPQENVMAYFSYNRGYLSGGINNLTAVPFEKENNHAYELGLKSSLMNKKVKLNLSAYMIDYDNLQVEILKIGLTEIENAAEVASKGIELESVFNLSQGIDIIVNAALNDSEYKDYSVPNAFTGELEVFSGNTPDRSPNTQLTFIAQYQKSIEGVGNLYLRGDYGYQSKQYFDRTNDEELAQEGFGLFNASIGIDGLFNNKVNASIYGYNIANQNFSVLSTRSFEGGYTIIPGMPRLIGVKLKFVNLWK